LGEKFTFDAKEIHQVTILPMHGEEPKNYLKYKNTSQDDVYGKYNTCQGTFNVVISENSDQQVWFSTQLLACKIF